MFIGVKARARSGQRCEGDALAMDPEAAGWPSFEER